MKKMLFLLCFVLGTSLFAQTPAPTYDKYSVSVGLGADLLQKPFAPKLDASVGFGYKFAANYTKPVDTVYGVIGYTGWQHANATSYHVGLQRTMTTDRDRAGLVVKGEVGATSVYGYNGARDVTKPSGAVGAGVTFDLSGDPYPKWLNHTSVSLVPMLNKIETKPLYWTLALGFTKSFN
jgi:hypothetical protein